MFSLHLMTTPSPLFHHLVLLFVVRDPHHCIFTMQPLMRPIFASWARGSLEWSTRRNSMSMIHYRRLISLSGQSVTGKGFFLELVYLLRDTFSLKRGDLLTSSVLVTIPRSEEQCGAAISPNYFLTLKFAHVI